MSKDPILYEFSSGVNTDDEGEFKDYRIGKYMLNSFSQSFGIQMKNGIPEEIDDAIKRDELDIQAKSVNCCAYAGKFIGEWAVVVVADRLPGRSNEVTRYFCVKKSSDCANPMLLLLSWICQENPRVEPRRSEVTAVPISNRPPSKSSNSSYINEIVDMLTRNSSSFQSTKAWEIVKLSSSKIGLGDIINIIISLPAYKQESFKWAISTSNASELVCDKKFDLITSPNSNECNVYAMAYTTSTFATSDPVKSDEHLTLEQLKSHMSKLIEVKDGIGMVDLFDEIIKGSREIDIKSLQFINEFKNTKKTECIDLAMLQFILFPNTTKYVDYKFINFVTTIYGQKGILLLSRKNRLLAAEKIISSNITTAMMPIIEKYKLNHEIDIDELRMREIFTTILDKLEANIKECFDFLLNAEETRENSRYTMAVHRFIREELSNHNGLWHLVLRSRCKPSLYQLISNQRNTDSNSEDTYFHLYSQVVSPSRNKRLINTLEIMSKDDEILVSWLHKYGVGRKGRSHPKLNQESYNYECKYLPGGSLSPPDTFFTSKAMTHEKVPNLLSKLLNVIPLNKNRHK